jgi:hypothetical protein
MLMRTPPANNQKPRSATASRTQAACLGGARHIEPAPAARGRWPVTKISAANTISASRQPKLATNHSLRVSAGKPA